MEKGTVLLKNVSKTFRLRERKAKDIKSSIYSILTNRNIKEIKALNDISIEIEKGQSLGIIGANGSGKSTLLNIILGAIRPDRGSQLETKGKILKLALGTGIDKNLSAKENIHLNASILGLNYEEIQKIIDPIFEFSGLDKFRDTPVKFFSKGMKQRLMFSIAKYVESDILLLDEFFGGVGDLAFKRKSLRKFKTEMIRNRTIIMVSHSMSQIEELCDRVLWLKNGKIAFIGNTNQGIELYKQHYTEK